MDELLKIYKFRFIGICISGVLGFLMLTGMGIWICSLEDGLKYGLLFVAAGMLIGVMSYFLGKYMKKKISRIEAEIEAEKNKIEQTARVETSI